MLLLVYLLVYNTSRYRMFVSQQGAWSELKWSPTLSTTIYHLIQNTAFNSVIVHFSGLCIICSFLQRPTMVPSVIWILLKYPKPSLIKVVWSLSDIAIFVSSSCHLDQPVDIAAFLMYFGITCLNFDVKQIHVNCELFNQGQGFLTRSLITCHLPSSISRYG